jgi:hypothetical protein
MGRNQARIFQTNRGPVSKSAFGIAYETSDQNAGIHRFVGIVYAQAAKLKRSNVLREVALPP